MKHIKTQQELNEASENLNISDVSGSQNQKLPQKSGWYWIMIKGYKKPTPCWYMGPDSFYSYEEGDENFLPGGIGDSSSNGIYMDYIERIGPEIEQPNF
jgi:hypothetical protein